MFNCIMSEHMKFKNTFTKKLAFTMPIITILLCIVLSPDELFQISSYNYWYAVILPGVLTLICGEVINKDIKKLKGHAILSLPIDPAKMWISKIIVCILYYFISSVIFSIVINLCSVIWGRSISFPSSIYGSILIFITFLWQIPLCLFLTYKLGIIAAMLINFSFNAVGVVLAIEPVKWIAFPYGITSRLMCPAIGVLPGGLKIPIDSPLKDSSVVLPGVMVSIILFILLSVLTALLFRKREKR
ncbi:lantibiotic immunity ABC transporter MutE/EpiE family permease subunit [Clostridium uliginosum]|uniref:ABC-2 type transport system permease protein n=1 Tax=Clostridium uliginosum TaxID=119641 RepID=A0A1I1R8P5_9CLOT|nr:lantibiotic immunity ABC transporter MutE/EpiE family permease subunit [Clostridium uliginosum]SFD28528.1 ABC-2 type transport system permease protein [Clostridium uliginosum]